MNNLDNINHQQDAQTEGVLFGEAVLYIVAVLASTGFVADVFGELLRVALRQLFS